MPIKSTHRQKYPLKKHLRNLAMMLLGNMLCVFGLSVFISPNELLAGGVWGISSVLHHFISPVPMGVFVAMLNVPLLIWGWNKLHLRFVLYTIYSIILQSVMLVVAADYITLAYTDDILLACGFGGLIIGVGAGLVVKFHGSGGGSEIVGIILKKKFDISVGSASLAINACVVTCAAFVFGFQPAMYTMVNLFITSSVFNYMLEGMNRKRNMMIVSEKGPAIAERLMRDLGRGVTMMKGEGGYTHHPKDVLFCVVSRFELAALKEIIKEVDADAFVCINQTHEVMGAFNKKALFDNARAERGRLAEQPEPVQLLAGEAAGESAPADS